MNRETLKKQALQNICGCFYFDFTNVIDDMTESELWRIVKHGWWGHIEQQLNQPVPLDEFYELLSDCDVYMSSGRDIVKNLIRG